MALSSQDALVYIMVVTSAADMEISAVELDRIGSLIERLPVFKDYSRERLADMASDCVDLMRKVEDLNKILDITLDILPDRLHDTAYALAVEIAAVDLELEQSELRWLEMMRDRLNLSRLTTAAIEASAKARLRKA